MAGDERTNINTNRNRLTLKKEIKRYKEKERVRDGGEEVIRKASRKSELQTRKSESEKGNTRQQTANL